ncbi:hypothetical protein [Anaerobranca gottschalkii]|uniref:Uncharacterized protein n=1 Tax=Anaerobranca gottschalkii DSM 13577 TaxID=1120990 RepID=A0A1I0CIA9_9FIRM|nr:hypothetical protein [Anaerobranca gottschalkii]SET19145.1 hypothetical protein SAMN03080614_10756 [Anaerobranca gottschalkii DSM 13577]
MFFIQKLKMNYILFRYIVSQDMIFIKRKLKITKYFTFYILYQSIALILFLLAALQLRLNFNEVVFFLIVVLLIISINFGQFIKSGQSILKRFKYDYFKTAYADENVFANYLIFLDYFISKMKMVAFIIPVYILIGLYFRFHGIIILLILECISFLIYKIRRIMEYNNNTIISFFSYISNVVIILFISYFITNYIISIMITSRNLIDHFGGLTGEYFDTLERMLVSEMHFIGNFFDIIYKWLYIILRESNIVKLILLLCFLLIMIYITKNMGIKNIGGPTKGKTKYSVFCYKIIENMLRQEETSSAIFFKDINIIKNYKLSLNDAISSIFPKENFILIGGFIAINSQINNYLIPVAVFHIIMLGSITGLINNLKVVIKDIFDFRSDSRLIPILRGTDGNIPKTIFLSKVKLATKILYIPLLVRAIPLLLIFTYFQKVKVIYLLFSLLFLKVTMILLVKFYLSGELRVFLLEYNIGTIDSEQYLLEDIVGYSLLKNYSLIPFSILNMSVNMIMLLAGFFRFFHGIDYAFLITVYSLIYLIILISGNYNLKFLLRRYENEEFTF